MSDNPRVFRLKERNSATRQMSKSEVADYHLSNFEFHRQSGDIGQSFSHLSLALCVLPSLKSIYYSSYLEVFENWTAAVEEDNGFQQAMTLFEVALKHYPESADLKYLLAKILYRHGSVYEAWSYACLAHSECHQDPNTQETRGRLTNALIDRWHLPMLNDCNRNSCFKSAIEEAVNQGHDEVLDVGSGTSLLSIFAKWAGAKEVYGCESDKFMCELASNILKSNVRTSGIKIFSIHSRDLTVSSHIPKRVSLVVSETVDAGLFGEHILSSLQHAWSHLLLPPIPPEPGSRKATNRNSSLTPESHRALSTVSAENQQKNFTVNAEEKQDVKGEKSYEDARNKRPVEYGKVIPSNAEVFVALINCDYIAKYTKLKNPNVTCFKNKKVSLKLDEPYLSEKMSQVPGGFKLLSDWTSVTRVDFNCPSDIDRHLQGEVNKTLELICINEGTPDALVLAFNLHLNDTHCISTLPEVCSAAWENAIYPVSDVEKLSLHDVVNVDFTCQGIINLSVKCQPPMTMKSADEMLLLSANSLAFLNSKVFIDNFLSVATEIALQLKNNSSRSGSYTFVICDTTPFPVAGLSVLSLFPNAQLYVEEETILKSLEELGITAKLSEDLEEEVDLLFIWPVTKEGTLKDGIVKKILMYRLMMAEDGVVFPQKLDLIVDAIHSSALHDMTRVDDANTCGVKVSEVFNIIKTNHQVDVHLAALHHTSILSEPIPVLRLSLTSGDVEALGTLCNSTEDNLLVIGGDVVTVLTEAVARQSTTISALPYWFILRSDFDSRSVVLSTRESDSPCNQSLLVLDNSVSVVNGKPFSIKTIWREGIFNATVITKDDDNVRVFI